MGHYPRGVANSSPFALLPCLEDDLRRVEEELLAAAAAPDEFVTELARHLRVRSARNGFFGGMHIKCTGAESSSVSTSEGRVVAGTMWCEEAETSQGRFHLKHVRALKRQR